MSDILWQPSAERVAQAPIGDFRTFVNQRHNHDLQSYSQLHAWSVASSEDFWSALWDFNGVVCQTKGERVLSNPAAMPGASWFPDAKLNYAANLLRRNDDTMAIIFRSENGEQVELTHAQLRSQVASLSRALRAKGVVAGDRVAGFVPNMPQAIVAMLATASIGAVWSSCSPDFGLNGVYDRFGQIEPKVLFTADGYHYNGKKHDSLALVSELVEKLPSIQSVVVINYIGEGALSGPAENIAASFEQLANDGLDDELETISLPFNHPLFIMLCKRTSVYSFLPPVAG